MMEENDLDVISVLADMGNGEVKDAKTDLQKINGSDASQSANNRIIHWMRNGIGMPPILILVTRPLGGHLVLLGLKNTVQVWNETTYKILQWAKAQDAVKGFLPYGIPERQYSK
jgi:hypothetical protein